METSRVVYDAFACLYASSLVLFFVDTLQPRRVINRSAVFFLFLAFSLESLFLLERLRALGHVPVYSPFDATLLVSWLVLLVALCVNAFFRLDVVLFFVNVVGFALVMGDAFSRQGAQGVVQHQGDLLVIHIATALLSDAAFTTATGFAFMYAVQSRMLREKRWNPLYFRLPSLERLDVFTLRSVLVGFPLLTIAIVFGAVWERLTMHHIIWLDPKSIMSMAVWCLYGLYLYWRTRAGFTSSWLSLYALACFVAVLANLWIVGRFSTFHRVF